MIKICFVCLGNICRSPMAEFIMKNLIVKNNMINSFYITSKATSYEEIGNSIYPPAKEKLIEKKIFFDNKKKASRLEKEDLNKFDYVIGMEEKNITNIKRILNSNDDQKIFRLLDYSNNPRDISDPWYTNDFEKAYNDIYEGCKSLLDFFIENNIV